MPHVGVLPHFDYADFMIGSASKTLVDRLDRLQGRAVKYIC